MYLQKVISKITWRKKKIFVDGLLKDTDEKNRIQIRKSMTWILESCGSIPKCHGSGTHTAEVVARKQYSVSVSFGPSESVIYLYGSDSFHQQAKQEEKPWFLFCDFFMTFYLNRMMRIYFHKVISIKLRDKIFFCCLESHWRKEGAGAGSVCQKECPRTDT